LERIARFLMPHFTGVTPERARSEILESLASYGARTASEMLNAAQIIAFGLTALDTLGQANTPGMSAALCLRYRGCANSLSRSCQSNEKALASKLTAEAPDAPQPTDAPEPTPEASEAETEALTQQVQVALRAHAAHRTQPSNRRLTTGTHEQNARQNRIRGGALLDALAAIGMPVQPIAPPHAPPP
jgi:hypothetical protein